MTYNDDVTVGVDNFVTGIHLRRDEEIKSPNEEEMEEEEVEEDERDMVV